MIKSLSFLSMRGKRRRKEEIKEGERKKAIVRGEKEGQRERERQ